MASYPQFAPQFKVQIGGQIYRPGCAGRFRASPIRTAWKVPDSVDVTFANPSLQWLNNPLLAVDQSFNLSIGYAPSR